MTTRRQKAFARLPHEQALADMRKTYLLTNRIGNTVPTDNAHAERVMSAILRRNKEQAKKKK